MITEYQLSKFKWVDIQQPDEKELALLRDRYHLSFEILNDLNEPISDTRIMTTSDQVYFAFHVVSTLSLKNQPEWLELDVIIIGDTLFTVVYKSLPAIDKIREELEIEEVLKQQVSASMEQFLIGLIAKIHQDLRIIIQALNSHLRRIETQIFNDAERQMVRTISETGRILFSLNQTISEQNHVVKFLPTIITNAGLEEKTSFFYHWQREVEHTADLTKAQYDLYHDLRRTNEELLATKQNEVMRKLTLVAFITSPLTILAGIFGMNTKNVPFVGNSNDFWIVLAMMCAIVIVTVFVLRNKGWFE